MATCPKCQQLIPAGAAACAACARGPGGAVLPTAPLPQPMIEPIQTPTTAPPDSKPFPDNPVLTRPLRGGSSVVTVPNPPRVGDTAPPAPLTLRDFAPPDAPAGRIRASGGTLPAAPGLPMTPVPLSAAVATPPPSAELEARPKFVVIRGQRPSAEFPVYEGRNVIGRFADKPVDIDLLAQEAVEQIWTSRQHAVVVFDHGTLAIEDLNSLNGTWVNGHRIHAGQQWQLKPGDVVQVGTVQMKVVVG